MGNCDICQYSACDGNAIRRVKWSRRTRQAAVAVGSIRPVVDRRSRLGDDVRVAADSRLAGSIGSLTF